MALQVKHIQLLEHIHLSFFIYSQKGAVYSKGCTQWEYNYLIHQLTGVGWKLHYKGERFEGYQFSLEMSVNQLGHDMLLLIKSVTFQALVGEIQFSW